MKLTAEIGNEKHTLDIKREDDRVIAEVDGRRYELLVREPVDDSYLLIADGAVYECRVDRDEARRGSVSVHTRNHAYQIKLIDPKRLRAAQSAGAQTDGSAQKVVAVMPGKVVRVLVEEGALVEAGQGLLVVEAMKMQNEMKSPRAGRVAQLQAKAGATVNAGDVLAVIE